MEREQPHSFFPSDAAKYGVDEAIMLFNLIYWITCNQANERNTHTTAVRTYTDRKPDKMKKLVRRTWTYNSCRAWSELYEYWTEKQMARILKSLERQGVIYTANLNKASYDRTLWYALVDEVGLIGRIHLPERENGSSQKEKPIPDTRPDTKSRKKRTTTGGASRQSVSATNSISCTPCFPAPQSSKKGVLPKLTPDQRALLDAFTKEWESRSEHSYPSGESDDRYKVSEIEDPREAIKYIRTLWVLDETDKWVKNSDHKFSVFVKEMKSGKIPERYPHTMDYYREMTAKSWERQEREAAARKAKQRENEKSQTNSPMSDEWKQMKEEEDVLGTAM
jgi:hypothetical protein